MRTKLTVMLVAFMLVAAFAAVPTRQVSKAQDTGMIACDSTTILLLYLAEYDYGFHSMMDVSAIDKGQFTPLFDMMMEEMMEEPMMEATEEAMMEEPMMEEAEMMEGMTMLMPVAIEGEPAECTALRAEVEAYLYTTLSSEMMMEE